MPVSFSNVAQRYQQAAMAAGLADHGHERGHDDHRAPGGDRCATAPGDDAPRHHGRIIRCGQAPRRSHTRDRAAEASDAVLSVLFLVLNGRLGKLAAPFRAPVPDRIVMLLVILLAIGLAAVVDAATRIHARPGGGHREWSPWLLVSLPRRERELFRAASSRLQSQSRGPTISAGDALDRLPDGAGRDFQNRWEDAGLWIPRVPHLPRGHCQSRIFGDQLKVALDQAHGGDLRPRRGAAVDRLDGGMGRNLYATSSSSRRTG